MSDNDINTSFIILSAFSAVCSSSIIFTGLLFPDMRKRLFMKIVMYIAICSTIANATSAFGLIHNEKSPLCTTQSFITMWLYKSTWLWTTALSYHLFCIVFYGHYNPRPILINCICWILPLVVSLLPLSTNAYGRDDDSGSNIYGWCFIKGNGKTGPIWSLLTFNIFQFVCIILVGYYLFRITVRYGSMNIRTDYPEIYKIVISMALYPAGFFITWTPNLIFSIILNFGGASRSSEMTNTIFNALCILATQSGTFLTVAFFWNCPEARRRWWAFLVGHHNVDTGGGLLQVGNGTPEGRDQINAEAFETQQSMAFAGRDTAGDSRVSSPTVASNSIKHSFDQQIEQDLFRSFEDGKWKPSGIDRTVSKSSSNSIL